MTPARWFRAPRGIVWHLVDGDRAVCGDSTAHAIEAAPGVAVSPRCERCRLQGIAMETWHVNTTGTAHAFDPGDRTALCGLMTMSEARKGRRQVRKCAACQMNAHNRRGLDTVAVRSTGGPVRFVPREATP